MENREPDSVSSEASPTAPLRAEDRSRSGDGSLRTSSPTPGQVAYEAYAEAVGWKSVIGERLPFYENMKPRIQAAWAAVAKALGVKRGPKIICLCGSSRFVGESAVKAWEFNKLGIATFSMPLLPQWYPGVREHHQAEAEGVAEHLDALWLQLIEMADEVFVVNVGGYIGERTAIEIAHAVKLGKPVNYLEKV
jgi:hypothetical protein